MLLIAQCPTSRTLTSGVIVGPLPSGDELWPCSRPEGALGGRFWMTGCARGRNSQVIGNRGVNKPTASHNAFLSVTILFDLLHFPCECSRLFAVCLITEMSWIQSYLGLDDIQDVCFYRCQCLPQCQTRCHCQLNGNSKQWGWFQLKLFATSENITLSEHHRHDRC